MSDDTWADESDWELGAEEVAEAIEEAAAPPLLPRSPRRRLPRLVPSRFRRPSCPRRSPRHPGSLFHKPQQVRNYLSLSHIAGVDDECIVGRPQR